MLASGLGTDEDCLAGAWVATVIGLPLLAFDFHWVNGDCSSANLLLGGGMVLAVAGDHLGAEGRSVAGQAVVLVVAVTILIVAVFTTNSYGMCVGGCDAGCCRCSEPAGGGQTAAAEGGHLSLGPGWGQLGLPPGPAHTHSAYSGSDSWRPWGEASVQLPPSR